MSIGGGLRHFFDHFYEGFKVLWIGIVRPFPSTMLMKIVLKLFDVSKASLDGALRPPTFFQEYPESIFIKSLFSLPTYTAL